MSKPSAQSTHAGTSLRAAATGLGAGRLLIGAALWFAPRPTLSALGFPPLDPPAVTLARVAATRDLVLGAWQLRSLGEPDELRRATAAGVASDGGDALAFALAIGAHPALRRAGLCGLSSAGAAALAGAWVTSRLPRQQRPRRTTFSHRHLDFLPPAC